MSKREPVVFWGLRVPMRDGVNVVADVYLPGETVKSVTNNETYGKFEIVTEGRVPAIVVRTPYGRSSDALVNKAVF